jgi:DNA-directed RNA polymerase subunit K/omega
MVKKKGTKTGNTTDTKNKKKLVVKNTGITELDSDSECMIIKEKKMIGGERSDQEDDDGDDDGDSDIENIEEVEDVDVDDDLDQDQEDAEIDNEDDDNEDKDQDGFEEGGNADDENCLYKHAMELSDDEGELDEIYDDGNTYAIDDKLVKPEDRTTKPMLTLYEKVRMISDRSKQLASNAKPMLKGIDHLSEKEQSLAEFNEGVIPMIIERTLPDERVEHWKLNELYY